MAWMIDDPLGCVLERLFSILNTNCDSPRFREPSVFLRAQDNAIAGMIPTPITKLSKLRELMLGKNEIYSDLPPDIGNMEDLEDLRVTENEMFGGIPNSLYRLKKLKKLWLEDTLYCEEILDDEGEVEGYDCDQSSEHGFEGSISSDIGNLSRLSQLIINNNPLTGSVPSEIGQCEALCEFLAWPQ